MTTMRDMDRWYAVSDDEFGSQLARLRKLRDALNLNALDDVGRKALQPVAMLDDATVDALACLIAQACGDARVEGCREVLGELSDAAYRATHPEDGEGK